MNDKFVKAAPKDSLLEKIEAAHAKEEEWRATQAAARLQRREREKELRNDRRVFARKIAYEEAYRELAKRYTKIDIDDILPNLTKDELNELTELLYAKALRNRLWRLPLSVALGIMFTPAIGGAWHLIDIVKGKNSCPISVIFVRYHKEYCERYGAYPGH